MLEISRLIAIARGAAPATPRCDARYGTAPGTGPRPVPVVVWNVCRHCNMSCPHCYAAAGAMPSPRQLTTAQGIALIDTLAAGGVRQLVFSGGEPLLRDDLLVLLRHATARGVGAHLSTNGVLIDRPIAASLRAAGVRYVGVSVDGPPEFNDPYRGLERAFERALAGLHAARDAGIKTGVRITVTGANVTHAAPMLARAAADGFDRFYVSHLVYAGRARSMRTGDVAPAQARSMLDRLFDAAVTLDSPIELVAGGNDSAGPALVVWTRSRFGAEAAERVTRELAARGGNSAGERLLAIDHAGDVHPDQFWRSLTLGNVTRDEWDTILAHPMRTLLAGRVGRLQGRCGRCSFVHLCRGSHRERAIAVGGGTFGADPACLMTDTEIDEPEPERGAA